MLGFMGFTPWNITLGSKPIQDKSGYAIAFDYMLHSIQRIVRDSKLLSLDAERVIVPDLELKTAGNAFLCGRYFQGNLNELKDLSFQKMKEKPEDSWARYQLAYCYGAIASDEIRKTIKQSNAEESFSNTGSSAVLDAHILNSFYMKQSLKNNLDVSTVAQFLNAIYTRTLVRYHTLKANEQYPMEWIEESVKLRNFLQKYFAEVSDKLVNIESWQIDKSIFNKSDTIFMALAPGNHRTEITQKQLENINGLGNSAVAQGIAMGLKALTEV